MHKMMIFKIASYDPFKKFVHGKMCMELPI